MPTNVEPYEILTGVGDLYIADVGTAFPALDATPGAGWTYLGNTQDGVSISVDQSIEEVRTDQETGPRKATRTEENLVIETKLAELTLENLALVLGGTVVDTAPGVGTIGTRETGLYRGQVVSTYAFLYRGVSAYGDFPAQYEVPVGYFAGETATEYTKEGNAQIGVEFHALVDSNAATPGAKFGRLVMQDAAAS